MQSDRSQRGYKGESDNCLVPKTIFELVEETLVEDEAIGWEVVEAKRV